MHKVAGLEKLNKELCKNLKEKNKSFMLGYPSDSFSENYRKILEIKKNDQDVSITVNICSDMKENDTTFQNDKNINQVIFGDSVSSIQNYSFKGCTSLRTVLISNSVTSIGDRAFEGCSSLLQITIPSSVQNTASLVFGCDPKLMINSLICSGIDEYEINELTN